MSYSVAVRALCSFTAKQGDLDRRFTPAPTAQEGILGHARAAARRGGGYETEVSLNATHGQLRIRGRADGYDADEHRLDEFKTHRGALERMAANHRSLHWAQLKTYGAMLCRRDQLEEVNLALVYLDVDSQSETVIKERFNAPELESFFVEACEKFSEWAHRELQHRAARDAALARLQFPHAFHQGQRQLAEAVYKAAHQGRCVLAQAPTGIGKTLGTLFPMLKAMAAGKIEKIFYLAAKTTGRQLALDALRRLKGNSSPAPLRVLDLIARDKACLFRDRACHGESCPLAKGFYDRLALAREAALACEVMDQRALREVALRHQVCPYYLSQEMVRWADVVVGDYNYYFDGGGLLFALTLENDWQVGVLVDEAHNLIERARLMRTTALLQSELTRAIETAPLSLKPVLERVARDWRETEEAQSVSYAVYDEPPRAFVESLQRAAARITDYAVKQPDRLEKDLEHFYFAALSFCKLCEVFGEHSLFDISAPRTGTLNSSTFTIRNVIPAAFLKSRFTVARCAILFSGTLNPPGFYQEMLGLPANTQWLEVASPFDAGQLKVCVVRSISTRLAERRASLAPISSLVAREYAANPGNYIVYVSSYEYLEVLCAHFSDHFSHIPVWAQRRSMSEAERAEFVNHFSTRSRGVAFALLGGPFAEAIDLPGERLIGAFIATLGMPRANAINDAIAGRLQSLCGAGHEYTYLYPGLQKVAQAAGRVIRTTSDRGSVFLIDSRYAWPSVHRHLPAWWRI